MEKVIGRGRVGWRQSLFSLFIYLAASTSWQNSGTEIFSKIGEGVRPEKRQKIIGKIEREISNWSNCHIKYFKRFHLDVDLLPDIPSAEVFAVHCFSPDPPSSCEGETPLLVGGGASLSARGGLPLELPLALLLDRGSSWITIDPRPLLY